MLKTTGQVILSHFVSNLVAMATRVSR